MQCEALPATTVLRSPSAQGWFVCFRIFCFRLIWFLSTKRPSITWLFLWTARAVFLLAVNFTAIGEDKCEGSSTVYSARFTHPFSPIAISCFLLIPVVTYRLFKEGHLPRPKVTLLRAGLCARVSDRTPGEAIFFDKTKHHGSQCMVSFTEIIKQ